MKKNKFKNRFIKFCSFLSIGLFGFVSCFSAFSTKAYYIDTNGNLKSNNQVDLGLYNLYDYNIKSDYYDYDYKFIRVNDELGPDYFSNMSFFFGGQLIDFDNYFFTFTFWNMVNDELVPFDIRILKNNGVQFGLLYFDDETGDDLFFENLISQNYFQWYQDVYLWNCFSTGFDVVTCCEALSGYPDNSSGWSGFTFINGGTFDWSNYDLYVSCFGQSKRYLFDDIPFPELNYEPYNVIYYKDLDNLYNKGYNKGLYEGMSDFGIFNGINKFDISYTNKRTDTTSLFLTGTNVGDLPSEYYNVTGGTFSTNTNFYNAVASAIGESLYEDDYSLMFDMYLNNAISTDSYNLWHINIGFGDYVSFTFMDGTSKVFSLTEDSFSNPIQLESGKKFKIITFYWNNVENYSPISLGSNNSYVKGYNKGLNQGYENGYNVGNNEGYKKGYALGVDSLTDDINDLKTTITNLQGSYQDLQRRYYELSNSKSLGLDTLFWSIGGTPFATLQSILNVDVLGFNLGGIISGLVTALVVIWLIKKVF